MEYKGKGIVITGAASGIGLASAIAFAEQGAKVLMADIESAALDAARSEVAAHASAEILQQVCDVSRKEDMAALAKTAFAELDSVDVVFHNAGVGVSGPALSMRDEDWRWVIDVNLWGSIYAAQVFVPMLRSQGRGGHLLFSSSFAGLVPGARLGPYSVSKSGVIALADVLRQELREDGINVAVLCPMRVATGIGRSGRNRTDRFGGAKDSPEIMDPRDDSIGGRVIGADEVAQQILEGIRNRDPYIMTHAEGRAFVERRYAKMSKCFERRTEPTERAPNSER